MTREEAEAIAAAEVFAMEAPEKIRRLEDEVAALQRELEGLRYERPSLLQDLSETHGELDALSAAVRTAQITHVREARHARLVASACDVCRVLTAISRDMPSRPDDPEEIRRLAQATQSTKEGS